MASVTLTPLHSMSEIGAGDDLVALLQGALSNAQVSLQRHDVLVVAQKIVSKAEGRLVDLRTVTPGDRAHELAAVTGKDARLVELILAESSEVIRARRDVLIVRHRLGFVMANAGIDRSNVVREHHVLLLPADPDASAERFRSTLAQRCGTEIAVIVSDSFGRPWRMGTTNVAIGAAGLPSLIDRRGEHDRNGRKLEVTMIAFADALAGAAGLVMGEAAESIPAVLVRGLTWSAPSNNARALLRPMEEDLFR
jgi:coenzyme F420-0:L-glutamate ligase/coenzyme F420-1:gamma-L-glutamate ligase